jgi:hypothetical protein
MQHRKIGEYCRSLGAEQIDLSELKSGLVVTNLRRLNQALELKPGVEGLGLNLNALIEQALGPPARSLD